MLDTASSVIGYFFNLGLLTKISGLIGLFITLFFIRVIYKLFIVPKFTIKYYASQKIKACLFPGADPAKTWDDIALEHGDCFHPWKEFINKNPDAPAFIDNVGPFVNLQLVDPKYVKEFFQKELECYKNGRFHDVLSLSFDKSLGFVPHEAWKARRRLYSQAFHYEFLRENTHKMENQIIKFCNDIHPSKLETFVAIKQIKNIVGSIVGELFFGKDLSNVMVEGVPIVQYLSEFCDLGLEFFSSPLILLFGSNFARLKLLSSHKEFFRKKTVFRTACKKLIAEKEEEMKNNGGSKIANDNNLLQIFIKAKTEYPDTLLNDESIVGEFMGIFFAGVDTTSFLLTNSCYFLASRPEIANKIREEVSTLWSPGKPMTIDIVNKFDYLYAFLKEVHRHASVLPNVAEREAKVDHQLLDLKIKKGTSVHCGFKTMSFNPKFFKNPYEFNPERFLKKDPEEQFNFDPFIHIPFSSGRHNCLGQHVANLESRMIVAYMLAKYDLELPKDYKYQLSNRHGHLPIQPANLKLTPRN